MDRFEWYAIGAVALILVLGFCSESHAMGQQEFCQALTADAARVVILRSEKRITYEQTVVSIPEGVLSVAQEKQLRQMIDAAFQTSEDPVDFAISVSQRCSAQLSKYEDEVFIHHPGDHHLSQSTIKTLYRTAWGMYKAVHPYAIEPDRLPRVGFATAKGICKAIKSEKDADCALGITAGEKAMYPLPDGVDVLLDERIDYNGSVLGGSIVLHELIHFMQYSNLGPISQCEVATQREREAYAMQAAWLGAHRGEEYIPRVMQASARDRCAQP